MCKHEGEVQWTHGGERANDVTYTVTWRQKR